MFELLKKLSFLGVGVAGPIENVASNLTPIAHSNYDVLKANCDFIEYYTESAFTTLSKLSCPWVRDWPLLAHSAFLNLGSSEGLKEELLVLFEDIVQELPPLWVGEDLGTNYLHGQIFPDIIPPIYMRAGVPVIADRVRIMQSRSGIPILIENTYNYNHYGDMEEWDFHNSIAQEADCGLVLDLGHTWISASARGLKPVEYIKSLDLKRVVEVHIASIRADKKRVGMYYDDHSIPIADCLLEGLQIVLSKENSIKALTVELSNAPLDILIEQVQRVRQVIR